MKRFVVTVTAANGQTTCEPVRLHVEPGDTVRWTSEDGHLTVDFQPDTPFTSTEVWKASRDQMTAVAVVKSGVPRGTVFRPTISINGSVVAESLGDIIFP